MWEFLKSIIQKLERNKLRPTCSCLPDDVISSCSMAHTHRQVLSDIMMSRDTTELVHRSQIIGLATELAILHVCVRIFSTGRRGCVGNGTCTTVSYYSMYYPQTTLYSRAGHTPST